MPGWATVLEFQGWAFLLRHRLQHPENLLVAAAGRYQLVPSVCFGVTMVINECLQVISKQKRSTTA